MFSELAPALRRIMNNCLPSRLIAKISFVYAKLGRRKSYILAIAFLSMAVILSIAGMVGPVDRFSKARTAIVNIAPGESTRQIAYELYNQGLIYSPRLFIFVARVEGLDSKLQAGEYEFATNMSMTQIIDRIRLGKVIARKVTIPEGFTLRQISLLLTQQGLVDEETFLSLASRGDFNYGFLEGVPMIPNRLEGYLFPDTYEFPLHMGEEKILDMMLERAAKVYTPEVTKRASELGLTLHQAVTLASLVEREAKVDAERPIIAAVFYNRLKAGMPLQSCATVEYLLDRPKEILSLEDIAIESPYNTYLHTGLPPGPIASPGMASLQAVLYPADVDYLYFVARKDGTHVFSRTLEEHEQAVKTVLAQ